MNKAEMIEWYNEFSGTSICTLSKNFISTANSAVKDFMLVFLLLFLSPLLESFKRNIYREKYIQIYSLFNWGKGPSVIIIISV